MKKINMILYAIPSVFIGMYIVYLSENIFTWSIFFLSLLPPLILSYLYIKNEGGLKGLLTRNFVFLTFNLIPIQILNKTNLTKKTGQIWKGYFKPFYSEQFFILLFMALLIIQITLYAKMKHYCDH